MAERFEEIDFNDLLDFVSMHAETVAGLPRKVSQAERSGMNSNVSSFFRDMQAKAKDYLLSEVRALTAQRLTVAFEKASVHAFPVDDRPSTLEQKSLVSGIFHAASDAEKKVQNCLAVLRGQRMDFAAFEGVPHGDEPAENEILKICTRDRGFNAMVARFRA